MLTGWADAILDIVKNFDALVDEYPAWWIDFLGEHNHVGGIEATKWLLERSGLGPGMRMLDAGAFVGAAARLAVERTGCTAYATDLGSDFLYTGREMANGGDVHWIVASTHRLPIADGVMDSVWCMDSYIAPKELNRVARGSKATVCICGELPVDNRGGLESFVDEWNDLGWELAGHRALTLEALQVWRNAEALMVAKRSYYEERYGKRAYLGQLDLLGGLVQQYERGEAGHGLLVFKR